MDPWDAIRAGRAARQFTDEPIPRDQLERILEAGRRSPSSSNWQPWDFVVVTDRAQLQELAKVWAHAQHVAASAATIALVAPMPEEALQSDRTEYDLGQATMSIMLAAADLRIGSGHSVGADQDRARDGPGLPEGPFCPSPI